MAFTNPECQAFLTEGLWCDLSGDIVTISVDLNIEIETKARLNIELEISGVKMRSVIFKQKEAKTLVLTITDNGVPVDLSAAILELGVKKHKSDTTYVINKKDTDFDKTQAINGIVSVYISDQDTNQDPWAYVGELKVVFSASSIDKSADLTIIIEQAVTN